MHVHVHAAIPELEDRPSQLRRRAVLICIATTAVVAIVEIGIGLVFNLISITAEGLHTGADLADSLIALFLVGVASKPADEDHPYGHGKYDSLAAIVEGGFVVVTAAWALYKGSSVLLGFAVPEPRPEAVTLAAMGAASVLYVGVSSYVLHLARVTRSPAVRAEALHLRTHVYITAALLVGLGASHLGMERGWPHAQRYDALAAIMLGVYLLSVGLHIMSPGFRQLMDTALPREDFADIVACLEEFRGEFVEIHAIRGRSAGTDRHVDIHLVVDAEESVRRAHDLAHRIETRVVDRCPGARLLIHIEPALSRVWNDYLSRQRVGRVVVSGESPLAHEAGHHDDPRAHKI